MARVITTTSCIELLLSRIDIRNCPASVRRTPSGFVQNYYAKWSHMAAQAGEFDTMLTEKTLRKQYVAIRQLVDRLGYKFYPESDPQERIAQITRAVESILTRDTKSGFMWQQIFERNPTYLDAIVMLQLWILLVDEARAARDNISESERTTRANQREIDRITRALTLNQQRIGSMEAEIMRIRTEIDIANRTSADLLNQLHALSGGDSDPSPTALTDSGQSVGLPGALAGDSGS